MIRIRSKREGFRRCGITHTVVPVEYPDDRFSKKDLAALTADPMLKVEFLDDPEPDAGGEAAADEISAMTVKQIVEEIAKYQPVEPLKGVKKAELIGILKAHIAAAAGQKE
ncbi:MAG TPA: hypothetical protein DGF30_08430 [Desulfomicrobium sp.]|jgi:hypothetical protein|nr:hypothetical protein [Desulfomicrobium sp.]